LITQTRAMSVTRPPTLPINVVLVCHHFIRSRIKSKIARNIVQFSNNIDCPRPVNIIYMTVYLLKVAAAGAHVISISQCALTGGESPTIRAPCENIGEMRRTFVLNVRSYLHRFPSCACDIYDSIPSNNPSISLS
jgi:hypothetical protein